MDKLSIKTAVVLPCNKRKQLRNIRMHGTSNKGTIMLATNIVDTCMCNVADVVVPYRQKSIHQHGFFTFFFIFRSTSLDLISVFHVNSNLNVYFQVHVSTSRTQE